MSAIFYAPVSTWEIHITQKTYKNYPQFLEKKIGSQIKSIIENSKILIAESYSIDLQK